MAAAAILDLFNFEILLIVEIQRLEMHFHAKFCQNRSIGCEDIKIFRFYKMVADLSLIHISEPPRAY